jgi:HEAT repeat protein
MIRVARRFLLSALAVLIPSLPLHAQEASYRGKTVAQWIEVLHEPSIPSRGEAAYALGQIGPPAQAAVPHLLAAFQNDPDLSVRQECAYALGGIGPGAQSAVPVLLDALKKGSATAIRASAAMALGGIGPVSDAVVPALIAALRGDAAPYTRASAASALGSLRATAAEAARPALQEAAERDENALVRRRAAEALQRLKEQP